MEETIQVPAPADFHVHLRQGSMCALVAPHVSTGGMRLAYVMPNLTPPITTTEQALKYKVELETIDPNIDFLMTLYLSPSVTPEEINKAHKAGIIGVKSYPRGVTTNSDGGIESYQVYYDTFKAMEEVGMILNIHGEIPSSAENNIHVFNAEENFLHHLEKLHSRFPKLKIVLEHATTSAAVECVKRLGNTVACTITPHHLVLIIDDWAGQSFNYCKPVAKTPADRTALQKVILEGNPKFFLGSDSAPHPVIRKSTANPQEPCAAGIYTSPILLPLVAHILEGFGALDRLSDFACTFGRRFYHKEDDKQGMVTLRREKFVIPNYFVKDENGVIPFMAGKTLNWTIDS